MLRRLFHRWILSRRWLTFIVLGLAFFVFGAGTLNIVYLLKANGTLLLDYGWQAVMDGGLRQLAELLLTGYASMAAYVVFKTCEHHLSHWLAEAPPEPASPETESASREN